MTNRVAGGKPPATLHTLPHKNPLRPLVGRTFGSYSNGFRCDRAAQAGKPFFVWHNTTRMHYKTNLSKEYAGKGKYGLYADGMNELDDNVGELLSLLYELGVADNTIVMFSTDNGAASLVAGYRAIFMLLV